MLRAYIVPVVARAVPAFRTLREFIGSVVLA